MKDLLNKIIKFFAIGLIIIFLLEISSFSISVLKYKESIIGALKSGEVLSFLYKVKSFNPKTYDENYRTPYIRNKKGKSIIIFGCSFAFGDGLSDNQTFAFKLSKLTGMNVYNRAEGGTGPQMMLYQLNSGNFKKIVPDCEYIIYLYAADPTARIVKFRNWPFLYKTSIRYKLQKNGILKLEYLNSILVHSYTYRLLEGSFPRLYGTEYCDKLFFEVIKHSYERTKVLYPNSKFIILVYSPEDIPYSSELKKMGIKIITLADLTNENLFQLKYQIAEYDGHPNEKAWDLITPLFIEKIHEF